MHTCSRLCDTSNAPANHWLYDTSKQCGHCGLPQPVGPTPWALPALKPPARQDPLLVAEWLFVKRGSEAASHGGQSRQQTPLTAKQLIDSHRYKPFVGPTQSTPKSNHTTAAHWQTHRASNCKYSRGTESKAGRLFKTNMKITIE